MTDFICRLAQSIFYLLFRLLQVDETPAEVAVLLVTLQELRGCC